MRRSVSFLCRDDSDLNLALNEILENTACWLQMRYKEENILVSVSCESYLCDYVRRQLKPFIIREE